MSRRPFRLLVALCFAIACFLITNSGPATALAAGNDNSAPASKTKVSLKKKNHVKSRKAKAAVAKEAPSSRKGALSSDDGGGGSASGTIDPPPPPDPADELKEYQMGAADVVVPSSFDGDVRDLPQVPSPQKPELELMEPADYVHNDLPLPRTFGAFAALAPAVTAPAPAPLTNFAGLSFLDTCTGGQCGAGHPPDTNGDVGLNHYIEGINESFAIYDKGTGTRLAAFTESSLWAADPNAATNTTPCNTQPFGDPIVRYDQTADRWILANLGFNGNGTVGPFMQCIAVSKSGDPISGGWWFYALRIDSGAVPANTLNDYPKFGVWNDGCLYIGANGFRNGASFNGAILTEINKSDLYAGLPVRWAQGFLAGSANVSLFPANMLGKDGSLPSPTTPEYYVQESGTQNAFNVRTLTSSGGCTGGLISAATAIAHATYNAVGTNIVPQPPPATTAHNLDSLGNRIMQPVQYRKVGAAESLWVVHSTRVTGGTIRPQWGQIDVTGSAVHTPIVQQQIYAPDTTLYRWMGSLAVDNTGNMAMGYSTSSANAGDFPSIKYSGRLAGDPLGTLGQTETTIIAGAGSGVFNCGGAICHRWGDYSSMSIDPTDDCTFWYTNMYYDGQANASLGNHQTRIASFKLPGCVGVVPDLSITKTHIGNFKKGQSGASYAITVTNIGPGYTFGTVTVADVLPASMTAVNMNGSGWTCNTGTLTCSSTSTIAAGGSYSPINLVVDIAIPAPDSVTNSATVSGSGDNTAGNNTASDPTTLEKADQGPVLGTGPTDLTYGSTGVATAGGGNGTGAYVFSSAGSTGCSVAGTTISVITASGTCILTAFRQGDADYNDSATSAPFTVTLHKADQTITWATPAPILLGTAIGPGQQNATIAGVSGGSAPGALTYTPVAGTFFGPGPNTLTVNAAETPDYNPASKSVVLSVLYSTANCMGEAGHSILQPINADGSSVFKQGSTTPAKFRVCDAFGHSIGTAGVVTSFNIIQVIHGSPASVNENVASTTPSTEFRWDPSAQQWIYNISTKPLSAGNTYVFRIVLNDGSNLDFRYGLR